MTSQDVAMLSDGVQLDPPTGDFSDSVIYKADLDKLSVLQTILLGDSGTGKTSFLVQFDTGKFQPGCFAATVGIGFTNKIVMSDGVKVRLQIWDTAGQERFRAITHAYYRDADALLLLYDVTVKSSFDNIRAWLAEIHESASESVVILLIGNKADMERSRVVRQSDGEKLAKEFKAIFMESSAKSGQNVEEAFRTIARHLRRKPVSPKEALVRLTEKQDTPQNYWLCCSG